jgi:hypothetical protein
MGAWNSIVVIACAALLFFLCRKEWLRANKARLFLRIAASLVAIVCLACMALPLTIKETKNEKGNEIIVTTDGAVGDSISSFKKNKNSNIPVVEKNIFLSSGNNEYDSIHVFGFGFTEKELLLLKGQQVIFHPSPVVTGMGSVNWKQQLRKGEVLYVQGTYVNVEASPVTLLLNGFNSIVDSVIIPAQQTKPFLLRTVPKQNGKAVFTIVALRGKDTLEKEPVPVEVIQSNKLKIMILAASPDFENKFLKDWLSQNGYTVVSKTNISTNKFDRSVLNAAQTSLDHITSSLLDSFDIVISDESSLSTLPATERDAVYKQVNAKGMGLIVRGDTIASPREWYTRSFHLFQLPGKQPTHISVSFAGIQGELPVEQPQFIRLQNGMQPLVSDSAANTMAAVVTEGSGKILFTTLNNTYSWFLLGNTMNYYSLWNLLLQRAGRQNRLANSFETLPVLPVRNEAVTIALQTMSDTIPVVRTGQSQPAFAQDPFVPYRWQTMWWPQETGWQQPFLFREQVYNWYVYDKNDWYHIKANERKRATEMYVTQGNGRERIGETGQPAEKPVSLFWFFLPFIICSGFLWLERKIS